LIKNKKIRNISQKEDGSLIAVMELPNKKLFTKTIRSFDNEQTQEAMKILENNHMLQLFCRTQLSSDYTPLFEYVSFDNRIVLKYSKPELILIGVRNNITGFYYSATSGDFNKMNLGIEIVEKNAGIKITEKNNTSLDELIELSKTIEDVEGWVIEFEDGQMVKIKSNWYWNLHGLRTMNVFREDWIVKNYLEEKLDDITSQLDSKEDEDAFIFIERVKIAVDNKMKYIDEYVKLLVDRYYTEYEEKWNLFASHEHKMPFFGVVTAFIQKPEDYNRKKIEYIMKNTYRLKRAQSFVDKWSGYKDTVTSKWKK
jgi:T4 RnlA family RNA ligase